MSINIPAAGGVPGISGPPDWFNAPPTGSFDLDDVRWRGATKTTFGAGGAGSNSLRAIQATVGGQQFIYLSFRAAFVQALSEQYDTVYLGLQRTGGTKAMVIQMQVHGPTFTPAGPPSANPPANIASVQIWTRLNTDSSWTGPQAMTPSWIANNARAWIQSAADVPADPNNRWAIELRIPAMAAGDIAANNGPNLGTDFDMWYVIHGATSTGSPVILADYRTSGTTTEGNLQNANFPVPFPPSGVWDEFVLTSGPAAFGGVALEWGDVVVQNAAHGEGWEIANGQPNTFVARPRNYRPAGNTINAGDINATFRIANWGSVADPNAPWDYVPGNNATTPVPSNAAIPVLSAGSNPPATNPIALGPANMTLAAGKNTHQCMLVTLSGNNLNFLNDSIFQNMNYDHASLLQREAEISILGLTPFSPQPRDVYLAIEKINMLRNMPAGTDEGVFLESTMRQLIAKGGALAKKLETARAILSDVDNAAPRVRPEGGNERLNTFVKVLSEVGLTDNELDQLFPTFRVHPYYDTGERITGSDGRSHPVLSAQSSFGIYAYHEGGLDGWQTSLQGAQRIADNLYLLAAPNNGTAKVTVRIQGVAPGEQRIPEDPIEGTLPKGCLCVIWTSLKKLLGL